MMSGMVSGTYDHITWKPDAGGSLVEGQSMNPCLKNK